jgi:hypothetical protein
MFGRAHAAGGCIYISSIIYNARDREKARKWINTAGGNKLMGCGVTQMEFN